MKKAKSLTEEQKLEAVRIAIEGKDPRVYLEECGQLDPVSAWIRVKAWCKTAQPHLYDGLPKRLPTGGTWHKALPKVESSVKVDGPIRIETPEANLVQVVETPEGCSGLFHGTKGEKAAAAEKQPVTQPVCYDGMTVREIEGLFGRYRRTDINGATYIDFENPDGADILSYTVDQWRKMRVEQANAFRILGVEL